MTYEITTANASRLIDFIFDCVDNGLDSQEHRIDTWRVGRPANYGRCLVHTTDQWERKGCLELRVKTNSNNRLVMVVFHYWANFPEEERNGDEDRYYFGRFTELMLVHFENNYHKITIE